MRWGLSFRGDLAKLDATGLSERLERLIAERDDVADSISTFETVGNKWLYQSGWGMPFGRGLVHAAIIYRIQAVLYGGSPRRGLGRLYVIDCELKDVLDECRNRLSRTAWFRTIRATDDDFRDPHWTDGRLETGLPHHDGEAPVRHKPSRRLDALAQLASAKAG
ncbi:hypothetical protein [Methylobacterium sp. 77]|uniref:hypothetical protein n=1 Tax=Methylobacterium sp. 77 TaxID=1101192 RepID=UPI000379A92B|nr:hypothetical protein [Methylobacterium sp. 77]